MSDVQVTVSGLPFNQKAISGISITYPYNSVPVASLQLVAPYIEQTNASFLCNPDQFKVSTRASPVTINLKSKTGCINFTGVFDGMSLVQSPGGFSYSAIIKSQFQCMHELYPKFPGIDPTSIIPFKRSPILHIQNGDSTDPYLYFQSPLGAVNASGLTLVEFYIALIKALLNSQIKSQLSSNTTSELAPILTLLQDPIYQANAQKCLNFLDNINLDYVKKTNVIAGQCLDYLMWKVINARDTLWDTLASGLDDMGCMLLPANNTLYVIPKASYLQMTGLSAPGFRQQATSPNQAYPADFSNFSINDVSYRNIRACFVVPMIESSEHILHAYITQSLGCYPQTGDNSVHEDGSTGILIVEAPIFLIRNIDGLYTKNDQVQNTVKSAQSWAGAKVVAATSAQQQLDTAIDEYQASIEAAQPVMNNYAKSRFLQEKYFDRGGSFNMQLKPSWVPGTTGFLYSRHPGLYYNFFVTSVTHEVMLGNSKVGTAATQVNFCACRYAGSPGDIPGVSQADLYNYSSGDMAALQQAWLSDVSGTAVADTSNKSNN